MSKIFKKEKTYLDEAIESRASALVMPAETADEDAQEIKNLKDLVEAKEKLEGPKFRINPNTILTGVVSIASVGLILWHERLDVITTKAIGWATKPKM